MRYGFVREVWEVGDLGMFCSVKKNDLWVLVLAGYGNTGCPVGDRHLPNVRKQNKDIKMTLSHVSNFCNRLRMPPDYL